MFTKYDDITCQTLDSKVRNQPQNTMLQTADTVADRDFNSFLKDTIYPAAKYAGGALIATGLLDAAWELYKALK